MKKSFPTLYTYDIGTLTLTNTNLLIKTDRYHAIVPVSKNVLYCQENYIKGERRTRYLDLRTGKQNIIPYLDFCSALPSLVRETNELFVLRNSITEDDSFVGLPDPEVFCIDAARGILKYKKSINAILMSELKNETNETRASTGRYTIVCVTQKAGITMQYVLLDLSKKEVVCKSDVFQKRLFSESGLIEYDNGKLIYWDYTDDVKADKIKPTGNFTIVHCDVKARKFTVGASLNYSDPEKVMVITDAGHPEYCDRIMFNYTSLSVNGSVGSRHLSKARIKGVTDEDRRTAIQDAENEMKLFVGRIIVGDSTGHGRYRGYRVVDACIDDVGNEAAKK